MPILRSSYDLPTDVSRRKTISFQKKHHAYDVIPDLLPNRPVNQTPLKQLRQSKSSDMYALLPGPPSQSDDRLSPNNCLSPVYIAPPLLQFDQKGALPPEMSNKEVDVSSNVHNYCMHLKL